jgi:hypothetical protein
MIVTRFAARSFMYKQVTYRAMAPRAVRAPCLGASPHVPLSAQIRIMMAALMNVGRGKHPPEHISELLQKKNRTLVEGMAPSEGLFFETVKYGDAVQAGATEPCNDSSEEGLE